MNNTFGILETKGTLTAVLAANEMMKAANITLMGKEYLGDGTVTVLVSGNAENINKAVKAGEEYLKNTGSEGTVTMITEPAGELRRVLFKHQ